MGLLHLMARSIVVVVILIDHPLTAVRRLLVDQGGDSRVFVQGCNGRSATGFGLGRTRQLLFCRAGLVQHSTVACLAGYG